MELWATVLSPGETIVLPEGWWHYAASLSPTVTLMCNFWDQSNVRAVEDIFTEQAARALDEQRREAAAKAASGAGPPVAAAVSAATSSAERPIGAGEPRLYRVVHAPFVYLRAAPSTEAPMLGIARKGATVEADAMRDGWLRLAEPCKGGGCGWVLEHGGRMGLGKLLEPTQE